MGYNLPISHLLFSLQKNLITISIKMLLLSLSKLIVNAHAWINSHLFIFSFKREKCATSNNRFRKIDINTTLLYREDLFEMNHEVAA